MDLKSQGGTGRIKATPVTTFVVLANIVLYLVWWAGDSGLERLAGDPRTAPWSMVTFGLLEPHALVGAALEDLVWGTGITLCLCFLFWLGGDLEKCWGTPRYSLFLLGTSATSYLVVFTCTGHRLTGPAPLLANLFMAWLTHNASYERRVMFMFTLRLGFFRWVTLGLVLLSTGLYTRFLPGLSALVGPLLSWWWSGKLRPEGERPRFQVIEGGYQEEEEEPDWEEDEIDRILDKISREGMNSLTAAERDLLDSKSQRLRR